MNRLAQIGVLGSAAGGVFFFLGLFPFSVSADATPGVGVIQIGSVLTGLFLLVAGAYLVVYALIHRDQPRSLMRDIGVRLGMTGLVFAAAALLADVMGFGSHEVQDGSLFGWLQALGMLIGFLIASIGVLVYATAEALNAWLESLTQNFGPGNEQQ
ncbi:MAG: hypothetical protein GYB68_05865 [Chloroflexi bacterium]|nr:hypothetical protein [Chloroflexota bacterium]